MVYTVPHVVGGNRVLEEATPRVDVYNPATGTCIGYLNVADQALVANTVSLAHTAFQTWSQTPLIKRSQILFKFREILERHQVDLARLVTLEHGKTWDDARGSIARAIELVEYHCGLLSQCQGVFSANVATAIDCLTIRQPLGVCAGVSPFNFPVMVPIWMMIPAIACGNAFILKPSEQAPSASVRLIEWLNEAGLPPGVVSCLQGDKTTVDCLLEHPDIAAFTAVASTSVAESIYHRAIAGGKRAHTFGGAKNHCVVMPDADLQETARAIVGAAFGSAGERCMAISVVVAVGDDVGDRLLTLLDPLVRAIRVDTGDAPGCEMGPLISAAHRERVIQAVDEGVLAGARLVIDGRGFKHPTHPNGYFMGPCLFDRVTESMSIYQRELFGPVLVMLRVASLEEAIALVNRNAYGNGTAIFTQQGYDAREYAQRVHVGMIGVNVPVPVPVASHPFGGWKRSSFGDVSMHGMESMHFYTRLKTITSKWTRGQGEGHGFSMPTHGDLAEERRNGE
jgi:malonate-semialdehyde dehydrogenase (acetylating)/methylmalonate-semialdehyde dehydrogenase